jgi:phytoene dehydrogenase-like protein
MIEALERTPTGREVLRLTELSPVEIIDEVFVHDRVRTLMLYVACMWGLDPNETGLGFMVPLMIDRAMTKAQCYGGSHKLAGALSREIHGAGGIVLDNAEITRILVEQGRVTGVECSDGRVLEAKAVLSSLAPPLTFGKLIEADEVAGPLREAAEHWEWDRWSFFTLSAVTRQAPHYETDDPWVDDALMAVLGFDTPDDVLWHFDAVADGRIGESVGGHATVQTRYDPTLARVPGHHISFLQVHAPYDVEGGWDRQGPELAERLMSLWTRHCPNLDGNTVMRSIESPVDIERRLSSMVRGSIKHGDYTPLQMGAFRPHDSCAAGRTPIDGLYLCGASSYPGGLVIGGPGYIAAGSVADDLGVSRWWQAPAFVRRYEEQYLS